MSDLQLSTRPATEDDFGWILDLLERNQRVNVPEGERSKTGFIQGSWTEERLQERTDGPGMWVAEVDGERAGVVLSSDAAAHSDGPPGLTVATAREAMPDARFFLYGPAVVEANQRGRGVLSALVDALFTDAAKNYDEAIAFVERSNSVSMSVHERLGFREVGTFEVDGREYVTFAHPTGGLRTA